MYMAETIRPVSAIFMKGLALMKNSMSHDDNDSLRYQVCIDCDHKKSLIDFPPIYSPMGMRIIGRKPQCKDCRRIANAQAYKESKERQRMKNILDVPWKERVAMRAEKYTRVNLQIKYGITLEQYQSEFAWQKGVCAICGNSAEKNLSVDHDHETGQLRGLLCQNCNLGLGLFGDSAERLKRAAAYLEKYRPVSFDTDE